ncbi:MAG: BON domain-containing protein [Granulosicoccus sp.]
MGKVSFWKMISKCLSATGLVAVLGACNIISAQLADSDTEDIRGAREAKSALMASSTLNAAPLRINKRGDVIELSGYVESEEERLEAEAIIRKLYPVSAIRNNIQLR